MTPKQACLNLLGLSRRASKQIAGEGLALAAIRNQTAKLVFIASDAGPTTAKKFHDKARLSRRASKQIAGEGLALAAIRNQTAKLVFIASDAGPTTAKKFHDKARLSRR
ncbi:hypothetical protein WP50_19870, partial [Lactiplantibacillus plantarum]